MKRITVAALVVMVALAGRAAPAADTIGTIANNIPREDINGNVINNFCGNMLRCGEYYYWVGTKFEDGDWRFRGINLYRSMDLASWEFVNMIIAPGRDGAPGPDGWCARPSLLYNGLSARFVCIVEINLGEMCAASSDTIGGNYLWQGHIQNQSGHNPDVFLTDQSAFVDDDGEAYLVGLENRVGARICAIYHLRPSDFMVADRRLAAMTPASREANHVFMRDGTYYLFASETNGWESSSTAYCRATRLDGPWSDWTALRTSPYVSNSYNSQHDFVIPIVGTRATTYMYCGDRWGPFTGDGGGYSYWAPLSFDGDVPRLNGADSWTIDVTTGEVISPAAPPRGKGYVSREVWTNVDGLAVADMPVDAPPDITDSLTAIEVPANWADSFGERIRGYLTAPLTGAYTFWISSDDDSELWLSTDDDPSNTSLVAHLEGWTEPTTWTKYASQKSSGIGLTAGQRYYIEILHKNDGGGGNLGVGWTRPGDEPNDQRPSETVPGEQLSPFDPSFPAPNAPDIEATAGADPSFAGCAPGGWHVDSIALWALAALAARLIARHRARRAFAAAGESSCTTSPMAPRRPRRSTWIRSPGRAASKASTRRAWPRPPRKSAPRGRIHPAGMQPRRGDDLGRPVSHAGRIDDVFLECLRAIGSAKAFVPPA